MSNSWIRNSRILSTASVIILMSGILANSSSAAVSAGSGCTKAGQTSTVAGKKFTCSLVWVVTSVAPQQAKTTTSSGKESVSQGNARKKASSYLTYSGFSRSGLIDQLVFEGFSTADATYGADSINANWNTQAARKAKSYLSMSGFSRSGLIDQLVFEGFSQSEAAYGASANGL